MKRAYFLLFALVLSFQVAAQSNFKPGFIIKTDGSRSEGLVDYRGNERNATGTTFKSEESASPVAYLPADLLGYGFNGGKLYESRSIKSIGIEDEEIDQPFFMEVLAKGPVSLYFLKELGKKERYFILKKDEAAVQELVQEVRQVKQNGKTFTAVSKIYIGTLTNNMADCAAALDGIEKVRLEQSDLIKLVTKYNACISPNAVEFAKPVTANAKFEKGILLGVSNAKATFTAMEGSFEYLAKGKFSSSTNLTGGFFLNFSMPKVSEKLSLHSAVMYYQYKYNGNYEYVKSESIHDEYSGSIEASYLEVPLMLRYTYPKGKTRPYFALGVQNRFMLDFASPVVKHSTFYTSTSTREYEALESYRKHEQGLIGGIGLRAPYKGKINLLAEARYEISNGVSYYESLRHTNRTATLLVGLSF
ncbi:porin family protein [Pontibacter vulgaris]|uniref:porin family protein n=1 Tax=Pontibacter vulgaris TaxID=2905679 RepID=UPI001FA6D966|nr:porin family protein [Pontibacter vulgaris]